MFRTMCVVALLVVLCSRPAHAEPTTSARLDSCIAYYRAGNFLKVVDSITMLMPFITEPADEVTLYQYLAFSYVMLEMSTMGKRLFSVALTKFPCMGVDTLVFPPQLTTLFYEAKVEREASLALGASAAGRSKRINLLTRKVIGSCLLASAVFGAGSSGYFYRDAIQEFDDKYTSGGRLSLWTGIALSAVSIAVIPLSLSLIVKRDGDELSKRGVCLNVHGDGM